MQFTIENELIDFSLYWSHVQIEVRIPGRIVNLEAPAFHAVGDTLKALVQRQVASGSLLLLAGPGFRSGLRSAMRKRVA